MAAVFAVLYFVRRVLRARRPMTCWPSSSLSTPGVCHAGLLRAPAAVHLTALLGGAAALAGLALFFLKG